MEQRMALLLAGWLTSCLAVFPLTIGAPSGVREADTSCTQIDFDQATLTSLRQCDYMQTFVVKRYNESDHFDPYRPETRHYLSNRWQGLTCGESVQTYSFNADTELRMAYNLIFDSGATLEVRVFDVDRIDTDGKPILVEVWRTTSSTEGWGFFREKLNKTVKQAKIQIEANINAASDIAIEYLTIFNYEVETDECSAIDEFQTTTELPSTTTVSTTTTTTTTETSPSTTLVITTTTSEASTTPSTTTEPSTTTTMTATTTESTTDNTTTNGPRDDTSMAPTPSSAATPQTSTTVHQTASSTAAPPPVAPGAMTMSSTQWMWMTLAALFATLFLLAASAVFYLWFVNKHLDRSMLRLMKELQEVGEKKPQALIA